VLVWEKLASGQRVRKLYDPPYYFYRRDDAGPFISTSGVHLKKVNCSSSSDFDEAIADAQLRRLTLFESDVNPLERILMDIYSTKPAPELTIGLLDIEVDYNPDIGYAGPANPYAPINAFTLCVNGRMCTVAVPPKSWGPDDKLPAELSEVILVTNEVELLELMLDFLQPCDVLSGWNSEFYDLPYIAKRIELVMGKHVLDRLALEGGPSPRWTEKARFKHSKEKDPVIDLISRVHLDYLRLFQKFDLTKRQSYSLSNVSLEELKEDKVEFDGTLAELYNNDFVKFVTYNIHDVTLLVRLDAKFRYIELANQMVHMASVNFDSVFGSVQLIDTAIMNYAHNTLQRIVNDRNVRPEGDPVEGAIVVTPNVGFYRWIGACDINSLYPSTIRSLNLSLEKLVGQIIGPSDLDNGWVEVKLPRGVSTHIVSKKYRVDVVVHRNATTTRAVWTYYKDLDGNGATDTNVRYGNRTENITTPQDDAVYDANEYGWRVWSAVALDPESPFKDFMLDVKFDHDPQVLALPANVVVDYCKENKCAVSAYGTILDQGNGQGLVPEVLTSWFFGRKEMQAEKKKYGKLADKLLAEGKTEKDPEVIEAKRLAGYYDMLQGVRKVLLNSTYGAMLNEYCRFGDPRIGASVTYSGRQITNTMINTVSKSLAPTGQAPLMLKTFDPHSKKDSKTGTDGKHNLRWGQNAYSIIITPGAGPIYGDTDSVYFTYESIVKGIDDVDVLVEAANAIADDINDAFPPFMVSGFNCQPGFETLIKANRELVCRTGLIQAKKKYMMLVVDKEGKRINPGDEDELKTMGSDIRLSSTPTVIRHMLTDVVMKLLNERSKSEIDKVVIDFRNSLGTTTVTDQINPLDIAMVTSVNNLDEAWTLWDRLERNGLSKVKIAPNARNAVNHNYMLEHFKVLDGVPIKSGDKIKTLWLLDNAFGFKSISFTSETEDLPLWFTRNFQVDRKLMEQKLVDNKLELIFTPMNWEVPTYQSQLINNLLDF
jgi:DNA polymerase elongation subunit (family B)